LGPVLKSVELWVFLWVSIKTCQIKLGLFLTLILRVDEVLNKNSPWVPQPFFQIFWKQRTNGDPNCFYLFQVCC
jgi:hypothetical protein